MNNEIKYIWKLNGHAKRLFNKRASVNNKHFLDTDASGYYASGIIVGTRRDEDYDCDILVKAELKQGNGKFLIEVLAHVKAFKFMTRDWAQPGNPQVQAIARILGMTLHLENADYYVASLMGSSLDVLGKTKPEALEARTDGAQLTEASVRHYLTALSAAPQIATDIFEFVLGLNK